MRNPLRNPVPKPTTLPPGHLDFWADCERFWREMAEFWDRQKRRRRIIMWMWVVIAALFALSIVLRVMDG